MYARTLIIVGLYCCMIDVEAAADRASVCSAQVVGHEVKESSCHPGLDIHTSWGELGLVWKIPMFPSITHGGAFPSLHNLGFIAIEGAQQLVSDREQGYGAALIALPVTKEYEFAAQDAQLDAQHTWTPKLKSNA